MPMGEVNWLLQEPMKVAWARAAAGKEERESKKAKGAGREQLRKGNRQHLRIVYDPRFRAEFKNGWGHFTGECMSA